MADALHDLGCPVGDRILVLNVLRGLNHTYGHLRTWITRQRPFPSFLQVRDDLVLEITKGPMTGSSSASSTALVATPPSSSAPPATSLLGAPPPGPSEGGGRGVIGEGGMVVVPVVGAHPHLLLLLVCPGHPSTTHGQGTSRCGHSSARGGSSSSAPASGHVHGRRSSAHAALDSTRAAQPASALVWRMGPGCSGIVLH